MGSIEAEEIRDQGSLRVWLAGLSEGGRQSVGAAIAIRMVLRVFPLLSGAMSDGWARTADLTALQTLRLLLTAGVQHQFPALEIKIVMDSEVQRVAFATSDRIAQDAGFVAYAAWYAYSVDTSQVFSTAAGTGSGPDFSEGIRDDARLLDTGQNPFHEPLWSRPHPDWFTGMDQKTRAIWAADPASWSFWLRWWDGVLAGRPLDWELQKQVALIPDAVWKQGPAAVAEAIVEVEISFAIARSPNAETIATNPQTGLIRLVPVSHLAPGHLADIVDTLRDAAKVFEGSGGPNGPYSALNDECRIIEDACDRYAHRPIMLLRICRRVVGRVTIKEANGDCPRDDALVRDFVSSIAGAAGDLMAFDPDVKQAETARAATEQAQVPPAVVAGLLEATSRSAEISEGELKHELPLGAQAAIHPAPSDDRRLALYETKSRLLRILVLTRDRAKNGVDHVEEYPLVYGSILAILLFLLA